ncbi:hypothetical protein [Mangrovibacterium lignilyticum]|uniref:hypothetical protein n=1 Tax=Mangrovibacterium lignilyticum TaxID=2668052 RepID=UPI0013D507C5|nr:hypothetical protein [Mangrovibacterium lignilyticum]
MATNPNPQQESRFINQVCSNTKTDFIEITEDKLENILIKFLRDLKKSSGWLTPLSIFITILITNLTADFKEFLSIPKEIWCAIFYLALALSFVWFIVKTISAIKNRKKVQLDYLINKIKNN